MAYEFLKKLFGTPKDGEEPKAMTYEELEAAIDADKDIQVVDLKAGEYVSKEKFDAKNISPLHCVVNTFPPLFPEKNGGNLHTNHTSTLNPS